MNRRKLVTGITAIIAAPAVIRVADLMQIRPWHDWDNGKIGDAHSILFDEIPPNMLVPMFYKEILPSGHLLVTAETIKFVRSAARQFVSAGKGLAPCDNLAHRQSLNFMS